MLFWTAVAHSAEASDFTDELRDRLSKLHLDAVHLWLEHVLYLSIRIQA